VRGPNAGARSAVPYIDEFRRQFRGHKRLAEGAMMWSQPRFGEPLDRRNLPLALGGIERRERQL
jgi:hypothetical protein